MPEGPEVKCRAKFLENEILGWTLINVVVDERSKYKRGIIPLREKVEKILTRGKVTYIVLETKCIRVHYGMEGNFIKIKGTHSNIELNLMVSSGKEKSLWFHDTRHFGHFEIIDDWELDMKKIGPDVFSIERDEFISQLKRFPKKEICGLLLDQKVVSGIGNYLRAEILFFAGVFPGRLVGDLSDDTLGVIFDKTKSVCERSYLAGGCSLKSYFTDGKKGDFELTIYGKGTKGKFKDGRTMFYDPVTQTL